MAGSKICVIGLGYMGLPTALLFSSNGNDVIGFDIDKRKIELLQRGELPFKEKGLIDLFAAGRKRFHVVSSLSEENLKDVSAYIICVPTPFTEDKKCDLEYVESAVKSLIPFLKKNDLLVLEATVTPGTTKETVGAWLESAGKSPKSFLKLAYASEKAIPGNTIHEMISNDRVVGGYTTEAAIQTKTLYQSFVKSEIHLTNTTTAEAVKVVENTFRDINIAFANELVRICEKLQVNVWEVIRLANRHPRVDILSPGPGVGGHCIAIDPWFLYERYPSELVGAARHANDNMPFYVVEKVGELIRKGKITNPKIGVLGVAYKKNVDDCRDAPSKTIIDLCLKQKWTVVAHDPHVKSFDYELTSDLDKVIKNSDLLILAVDHDYYSDIDFGDKLVFDTRNSNLKAKKVIVMGKYE